MRQKARTLSELSWTLRQGTRSIHQNRTSLCAIRCRPGRCGVCGTGRAKGIRIYYKGKDVTNGTVYYEMKKTNNNLKFTDKILGGKYDSKNVTWDHSGTKNGGNFNANGDVYNVELMDNETTDQFVITVTSKDDTSLTAKVTVNVAHPINILHCDADKHFNLGQTHQLFIDEGELKNSSLNGKYQIKDFVWHMEVESVSSTGATEHKGDISFRMGDDAS